jgi:hypothetical protein
MFRGARNILPARKDLRSRGVLAALILSFLCYVHWPVDFIDVRLPWGWFRRVLSVLCHNKCRE